MTTITMGYRQVAGIMLSSSDSRSSDYGMRVPRMVPGNQDKMTIHQWSCEVCKSAVFDNYDDAFNHEILCRYKQEQGLRFYHDREKSPESIDNKKRFKRNIPDDYPVHPTNPTESPRNISSTKKPSKKQRWICDVCRVAKFHSYVDAYVHERDCIQLQGGVAQEQEQRGQPPNNSSRRHHSPSKRRQQLEERGTKNKSVKWLCSVCEVACFDDYEKACDHEARCTRLWKMPVPSFKTTSTLLRLFRNIANYLHLLLLRSKLLKRSINLTIQKAIMVMVLVQASETFLRRRNWPLPLSILEDVEANRSWCLLTFQLECTLQYEEKKKEPTAVV